ncbi:hypothetical protein B0H13DRAFT_2317859 [Mycena leptocephala]|nr:hypothetical protein B0H13DRAFT_2317859 [Mycena leptocephala]
MSWTGKRVFRNGSLAWAYCPPIFLTISGSSEPLAVSERWQPVPLRDNINDLDCLTIPVLLYPNPRACACVCVRAVP